MNELGNSPPFVLSGQKVILKTSEKLRKNVANSVDANEIHKFCKSSKFYICI